MLLPFVSARMKKKDWLVGGRIQRRQIGSLKKVAIAACEREILQYGLATMLQGYDVIGLVWNDSIILVQAAVLALAPRPLVVRSAQVVGTTPPLTGNLG